MTNFIRHSTCNIAYSSVGEGQVLVFLHGFCERRTMWASFVERLMAKYRVITIDLPGFGDSDLLPDCSIEDMAAAVNSVLEKLAIDKAHFIGHSMGGYVSLAFAEQYGEKLQSLTLFHSHPFADSEEKKVTRNRALKFVAKNGTRIYLQQMIPTLFGKKYKEENKPFIYRLIEDTMKIPQQALLKTGYAMLNRKDRASVLAALPCPVLFIIGDEDEAVPFALSLEQVTLPSVCKVHIQREVGHMGMYEAFDDSFEVLADFLMFF